MTALFLVVMISYFLMLLLLILGWKKSQNQFGVDDRENIHGNISIIVPFRNEALQIHHLIRSLSDLKYSAEKFNVILVNDHSEDNSENVVHALIHDKPGFLLLNLTEGITGKKAALTEGIKNATGDIIVTTDADCVVHPKWLDVINSTLGDENIQFVFGGVRLQSDSFFSQLQAIEFSSLIGSAAATLAMGHFSMCNGANLAFRKSAFEAVKGYDGNLDIPSGDDEFLARKIATRFPGSIRFISVLTAVVVSRPLKTIKAFIHQRLRWAGKWKYNSSLGARALALYMLLVQLVFIGLIFTVCIQIDLYWLFGLLIFVKILLEFLFIYPVARFLGTDWSWGTFLVLQLIYPFYVITVGVMSQGMGYNWKGRSLSHKM